MALAMGLGDVIGDVTETYQVPGGDQHTPTRVHWMESERVGTGYSGNVGETLEIVPRRICRRVQIREANGLMMRGWMMLGEIVGSICLALAPINLKLSVANLIADPIKNAYRSLLTVSVCRCQFRFR